MLLIVLQIITLVMLVFLVAMLFLISWKQRQINASLLETDTNLIKRQNAQASAINVMSERISELHERK